MALRVVLTGGIATGKSAVAAVLRDHGVDTIDADQAARLAVAPGSAGLAAVTTRFGSGVLAPDGSLDRSALGRLVFADGAARADLERIVHPRVRVEIEDFFAALPAHVPGVAEVPLAYETGWATSFDVVVVVACRPETQRLRLAARDGLDREAVEQRLAAQWPIADKARLADAVVMTEGSLGDTRRQAEALAAWLGSVRSPRRPS